METHRSTVARRAAFLAFALMVSSCTDAVGPRQRLPAPEFSFSASGITINKVIGTLGENGTTLGKGFDTGNPHLGDAIVASFVYLSTATTNIIDSVHDNL